MALPVIGNQVSVPMTGASIAATALDPSATQISFQMDITNHLAGNPASIQAFVDLSQDAGITWNSLIGCARSQGFDLNQSSSNPNIMFATCDVPGVGNLTRMIRATALLSQTVTTAAWIIQS
jgi:hypothetical protein